MHKVMINKIIAEGNTEQMHELKELFDELVCDVKMFNYELYIKAEYDIHKIAYGKHIGKEIAEHWVGKMKNKDGTHGAHWTIEQTTDVMNSKGLKFDKYDWYVVLNMVWSDFYNSKFDTNTYIEIAKDWLEDDDINKCKLLNYYYYVVMAK